MADTANARAQPRPSAATPPDPAPTSAPAPIAVEPGAVALIAQDVQHHQRPPTATSPGAPPLSGVSHPIDIESSPLAWLCVLGAWLFLLPTYGFMQAIGVIQSYLQLHQLDAYSARDIGWITGMLTFLALLLGIQVGPVLDVYGSRYLAPASAVIVSGMFFLLAECKVYWHFMLCLGVLGGIGGALASTVAMSCVAKLFVRRRGLAVGIAMCGSSIGAIAIPLMLRQLFSTRGWTWAIRALGFFVAGIMGLGVLCLMPYQRLVVVSAAPLLANDQGEASVPTHAHSHSLASIRTSMEQRGPEEGQVHGNRPSTNSPSPQRRSAALNFSAFNSPSFSLITAALFLMEFVVYGISGLLPTYAIVAGFSPETGYTLIALANGCGCLGRIIPGLCGDHFGHFNVLLLNIVFTLVFMATIFVPFASRSLGALYAFAALWGFGSGAFLSLTPVCMGKTCDPKDYGRYFGTMNFIVSFALLICIPIGGHMLEVMGPMALSGFYLAIVFLTSACFFGARALLAGGLTNFRHRI
ncbi:hypothetical protein MAPG_09299 [Magnaporthiopsis poae ATCC 64411]|uniref:Major facilitator superfamily (MFS) profile domain-containing protein n=1 Tax=Magnaporthiopsis poae (strain ATCC 64411 / 73-15) TaxID=644358 RepID=A0A0C4E9K6_MAGP6|nr:hypothetical protein MAPG_09299 [Magnaporthiopsis poae ATCC 64411]